MIENGSWRVRFVRSLAQFSILILVVLGMVSTNSARAGDGRRDRDSDDRDRGGLNGREHEHSGGDKQLATDWSHRHLVYSGPRDLAHAFSLSRETRYKHQWVRRNADHHGQTLWRHQEDPLNKDWSEFVGNAGTVGAGHYPAKYSFDATTATCGTAATPDFVVFNTSLTPSASATSASVQGTFAAAATPGDTTTITNPVTGLSITLTAQAGPSGGLFWQTTGTTAGDASNLAASIALNGPTVGVTGSAVGSTVTATSTDVGDADNFISVSNSNAASFTWAAATLGGGTNGASVAAFDNLYSGCTGTVPSVFWAYNTGGIVATSVSLSGDGTQIAFVQNNTDGLNGSTIGVAELVILKWKASATDTVNVPTTISFFAPGAYRACAAPCMTRLPFSTLQPDANSAPFYDFAPGSDKMYVGDNNGSLLQYRGVFNGTPAEFTTAPWPVVLTAAAITTSPVFYEGATAAASRIFIADNSGLLYAVTTAGAVTASGALGFNTLGIQDGPIVDSSAGKVYVFVSNNGTAGCGVAGAGLPAVYQLPVTFLAGGVGTNVTFGTCSDAVIQYDGQFDNAYYTSASGNAGHLYVCGNPGGNATLYQIPLLASGLMGALSTGPALSTANTTCSPVTEVFNPGAAKDWIFMSVQASSNTAAPISCPASASGGCVMSFDVTSGAAITPAKATAAKAAAAGGTSGIVGDNTVGAGTLAGASQVYFSTLVNGSAVCTTSGGTFLGGCAVQASQVGLN